MRDDLEGFLWQWSSEDVNEKLLVMMSYYYAMFFVYSKARVNIVGYKSVGDVLEEWIILEKTHFEWMRVIKIKFPLYLGLFFWVLKRSHICKKEKLWAFDMQGKE